MITHHHVGAGVIPAARFPYEQQVEWETRSARVLCDDCLAPAAVEVRLPRDPERHEICAECAEAPYYYGAWVRPLATLDRAWHFADC